MREDTKRKTKKRNGKDEIATGIQRPDPLEYGSFVAPPFYGTGEMLTWDVGSVTNSIDKKRLYRGHWHGGKINSDTSREPDLDELFTLLSQEIITNTLIDARGFYGFYPVISDDNQLILLSPNDFHTEIASFKFPRREKNEWRCIADYFRPEMDILSVQAVTIGAELQKWCEKYFQSGGENEKGNYLNGIGSYLMDLLADKVTAEIRRALFLSRDQGLRFKFSDPNMPDLEKQKSILDLLCAEDRLGITLSKDYQLHPEHSSLGIFVHHPEVKNF